MDSGEKKPRQPNPRQDASIFSVLTFSYTFPLFIKGYKKGITDRDLYHILPEAKSSKLGNKIQSAWNSEVQYAEKNNKNPSMWKIIRKVFFRDLIWNALRLTAGEFFWILLCVFLKSYLKYFLSDQQRISREAAYGYACGIILCLLIEVTIMLNYFINGYHLGMKIRVSCSSLIYRKMLTLSQSALDKTNGGQIINLLSNDVNKFDALAVDPMQTWIAPIDCIVCGFLMYEEVGVSAVVGIAVLVLFLPMQVLVGFLVNKFRRKAAPKTDKRIRLINEVISGIQVIKMYAWEIPFGNLVSSIRRSEMKYIGIKSYMQGIIESSYMFSTRFAIFCTIVTYVSLGNVITAEKVFFLCAFYNTVLRLTMTIAVPQSMTFIPEANVSFNRIIKFLLLDEHTISKEKHVYTNIIEDMTDICGKGALKFRESQTPAIEIRNVTAKWKESAATNTLNGIDLDVHCNEFLAILGPVGNGKTSLLQLILKELPPTYGTVEVRGKISYASQEPWLFPGTLRQNILFGLALIKTKYENVIKVCALQRDLDLLPYGDLTVIGDKGISLSGGQRARINLARAVYREAEIYLLDDPLSAVDANVGRYIFENCICGYLRQKIVILCTHQLQLLKEAKRIIYMEDGRIKAGGSYESLTKLNLDLAKLETENTNDNPSDDIKKQLKQKLSLTDVVSIHFKNFTGKENEEVSKNTIDPRVFKEYLRAGGNWFMIFIIILLFLIVQIVASLSDYVIAIWADAEQYYFHSNDITLSYYQNTSSYDNGLRIDFIPINEVIKPDKYNMYMLIPKDSMTLFYTAICLVLVIITFVRSFMFYYICNRASITLHNEVVSSLLKATMRFFNLTGSGRILNRLSNDIGIVDEVIPSMTMKTFQVLLASISSVILVNIVSFWFIIPTIILVISCLLIRHFYVKTGRSVLRLERMNRSPVLQHVNASLKGLATLRAFEKQEILQKEFDKLMDLHSSAFYTYLVISRCLSFWLDIVCVVYAAVVTLGFLVFGKDIHVGDVGLAVTQVLSITRVFQWGARQTIELENLMTSVERIIDYKSIEHEKTPEDAILGELLEAWPQHGKIEFKNVFLNYMENEPPVLNKITFNVRPKEKIGIVGRTGAGKSSIINAIFQLADTQGHIFIDDVDISKVNRFDLRSKISIIPQQPVLFSGTLRKNLDPLGEHCDTDIWKALEEVELKKCVCDLNGGLDYEIAEEGLDFSVGQRQLLSLARAILKQNKILIMDEATANVDQQTDRFIQKTIRKKFKQCTILTIAHRLNTIIDSGKVLVMDEGKLLEFDHPYKLLQNTSGLFYKMAQKTGSLKEMLQAAEINYKKLWV